MHTLELYITLAGDIFETFCFADEWTFVPDHFAYSVEHIPSKDEALKYMTVTWQYLECLVREVSMSSMASACFSIEDKGIKKPLDRTKQS